jgi:hypothetical protein
MSDPGVNVRQLDLPPKTMLFDKDRAALFEFGKREFELEIENRVNSHS